MSDALTSATSTPAPASPTPAPSATAAEQAQSSKPASQPSAPQQPTADARPRTNLQEIPEFRQWQAQVNRTMAQFQQQAAQAAAELERQKTAGMDDLERAQYEAATAKQQLVMYQQQVEAQRLQAQRDADLAEISRVTGIPKEELDDMEKVPTYADAWKKAAEYQRRQVEELATARAAELKERAEANAPDIGGGAVSTPVTRQQKAMADALKNLDSRELLREVLYGE